MKFETPYVVSYNRSVDSWLLLDSGPGDPAGNMALDEALLETVSRFGQPVLRFYGWTEPAATFGYFQKYADVERATPLRPLIRRPTGGGIVPHDSDWTYSLVFPPGHEWHALKADESYRRIHEWIRAAFAELKIATELAPFHKKSRETVSSSRREEAHSENTGQNLRLLTLSPAGQCFIGHEKSDLLWQGRKIAGAAQRRNRLGLLIQGSVQPPRPSPARTDWQKAVCKSAIREWEIEWMNFEPDSPLRERAELLTRQKYSQAAYNHKR